MKNGWIKIVGIAALVIFLGMGVSFAGGRDCDNGRGYGHGYGQYRGGYYHPQGHPYGYGYSHYRSGGYYPHYPYYGPSYYHSYRPPCSVPPPVVHPSPGYFFGMSAVQPGVSFGFGIQGH
jgi:hypothetical protein